MMRLWLSRLCLIGAIWFTAVFIFTAVLSITYPYPLEWMEGQSIDVIARVVAGQSIYVEPSIEYVPFIYPPLYFHVAAALSHVAGVGFVAARLVSFLAALGIGAIIYCWVRKEQGARVSALVASGLFYATYELSARWFDVGRIDSLYVFLLLAALYIFFHYQHVAASVAAGLLFTLAFLTKQNTLIAVLPALLAGLWLVRAHAARTIAVFALSSLLICYMYNEATDGWFRFYLFTLPSAHRIDTDYLFGFWWGDLLKNLTPLILLCLMGWWHIYRRDPKLAFFYLALAAGLIAAAYAGRLHRYGWSNVLIPAHALLALAGGLALARLSGPRLLGGLLLAFWQMASLLYNPLGNIPNEDARHMGDAFVARVAQLPGEVFMPEIQFVPSYAGKKSFAYGLAAIDVMQSSITERDYVKAKLRNELADAVRAQRFGAVVTSLLLPVPELQVYYAPAETIGFPRKFVSGFVSDREMKIYLPIDKTHSIYNQLP